MSPDASRMWIRMAQKAIPAILDLRHTPAVLVKTEVASRPASPGMNLLCSRVFRFRDDTCLLATSSPEESTTNASSAQEGNLTRLVHLAEAIWIEERGQPTTSQSNGRSRSANVRFAVCNGRVCPDETVTTQFVLQRARVCRDVKKESLVMQIPGDAPYTVYHLCFHSFLFKRINLIPFHTSVIGRLIF